MNVDKDYRYHPDSDDIHALCKQFEEKLPTAKFGHKYINDNTSGQMLLKIEAWDESKTRYYAQVLRDSHEPTEIIDKFCKSLNPKSAP